MKQRTAVLGNISKTKSGTPNSKNLGQRLKKGFLSSWQLYILLLPTLLYFLIFNYFPMYGIQIAFKDYKAVLGIAGSEWVGLKHFQTFFSAYYFKRLVSNTLLINIYSLLFGFPIPILVALILNSLRSGKFKSFVQTVIYVPHFISEVVLAGMLYIFLSPSNGLVNKLIEALGGSAVYFLNEASWFRTLFVGSGIWQNAGWNSILYIAALTGIDSQLYEAATIDGASKIQKIRYIDIPHIIPVATMMIILNCGSLLSSATTKALLFQTGGNISTSDIIGTYVYNMGLGGGQFSYTAAINLCVNVINFIMVIGANTISKKMNGESLF